MLEEIRERLKSGLPCRVVSTSLIEAGVDVDFPTAWREEAGLDSIIQTAGRCNREGKASAEQSIVTIFRLEGQHIPAMIHPNVDSARHVLQTFADPAQPKAIESYFSFYRTLKGSAALDQKGILDAFQKGYEGRIFPFAAVADMFHLIDSPTTTVYIPTGEGKSLVESLRAGFISRSLFRKLGQYAVNVYPDHLKRLLDAGTIQVTESGAYILTDKDLYHSSTGLALDVEMGKGWFM